MTFSNRRFGAKLALVVLAAATAFSLPARAGGYDTGERDWEFLFQSDKVAFEAGGRYIVPRRTLNNIIGVFGPSPDVREAEAFFVPRLSVAANFSDAAACMTSYREPWGGHANYGAAWTYAASAVEQHFSSRDYGLTCKVKVPFWRGNLHFIGGVSYQTVEYQLIQALGPVARLVTDVGDSGVGWRAGVAFDIPEYALRTSIIYNSAIDYSMTGTLTTPVVAIPIFGGITMPQSVEWRAQSGVAQDWLAFGAVKWTDWSVAGNMPLCPVGTPACSLPFAVSALTLMWKDTWTVTLGAAHRFNDVVSVAASLTWDQGATQGFTSQTDTWMAQATMIAAPNENLELHLGGGIGLMTGGSLSTMVLPGGIPNPVGYTATFGDDVLFTVNASAKLKF
ncbi:MAG: transporter [Rhizobiaceae bacterium]